jgi:light-regulated signal transduction histidine kinase (bacteriophytochrome)
MIYRFDAQWNGEVVGESRRHDLEPYLGLSYPAGDIPAQARRLYEVNLARYIPDVHYTPQALRVRADCVEAAPLDMSLADLRGISPVHIEYLRNMGVRATFVLSLMVGGRLWGLIACHHYTTTHFSYEVRAACELLSQVASLKLAINTPAIAGPTRRPQLATSEVVATAFGKSCLSPTNSSR